MLPIERMNKIMEILKEEKSVMVSELSSQFNVADETIRRDLEKLEAAKKIVRVHGGAYLFEGFEKGAPASLRKEFMIEEKETIVNKCLEFIEEKDIVMLDNSTTSLYIAKAIRKSRIQLVVITNYLDIIQELSDAENVKLIGLGGTLNQKSRSFSGPMTTENISDYYAHKSFISCSAVNANLSLADHNEHEGQVRKMMLQNAEENYLVIDHTKIDATASYRFGDMQEIKYVITNKVLDELWEQKVKNMGIEVIKTEEY